MYHLTELPSFVSGKYVVMFDPQGIYLPKVSAANPGKRIDFIRCSAISQYRDQFLPYCAFDCDMESSFDGTLFRLPLRNADQAARSKISRQAYTEEDISSMFAELYEEGVLTLLFLKSVLCIEMFVWNDGEAEPQKLYSFSVRSASSDIIWHRQMLLRLSKSTTSTQSEVDSFSLDFLSQATTGTQIEERIDSFFIVQTMASATSRISSFAATASKEYDIHLLPWASLAVCTSDDSSKVTSVISNFLSYFVQSLCHPHTCTCTPLFPYPHVYVHQLAPKYSLFMDDFLNFLIIWNFSFLQENKLTE